MVNNIYRADSKALSQRGKLQLLHARRPTRQNQKVLEPNLYGCRSCLYPLLNNQLVYLAALGN